MPLPDLILLSRNIVTPDAVRDGAIIIRDGRIVDVIPRDQIPAAAPVQDHGTLAILPGLIDPHVHVNEPGRTDWEGFETATNAAAAAGITTIVEMPLNASPVTTTAQALATKLESTRGKLRVDTAFHGGLVPANAAELQPLLDAGVVGIKAFLVHSGIDDFPAATQSDLRLAMPLLAKRGIPLLVHAELDGPAPSAGQTYASYLRSRPRDWENRAVRMMIALCRETGCHVHIVHLSSSDVLDDLRAAKQEGLPLTVETCPHYLCFQAEQIADGDTRFKCAPPIRENENRNRLWHALLDGTIDLIASDHSPCPPAMKAGNFAQAWGGIASLQLGPSAVWNEARQRGFPLSAIAQWMSAAPAQLLGMQKRKGDISPGHDADLVVFDPQARWRVQGQLLFHRHKLTPYENLELAGIVHATYVRGQKAYEAGQLVGPVIGRPFFMGQT